jgi:hypothetical protein
LGAIAAAILTFFIGCVFFIVRNKPHQGESTPAAGSPSPRS